MGGLPWYLSYCDCLVNSNFNRNRTLVVNKMVLMAHNCSSKENQNQKFSPKSVFQYKIFGNFFQNFIQD